MYNDHVSHEEVQEVIKQRMQEAENYALQKRLGFCDSRATRWAFLLIVILAVVVAGLLL